MMEHVFEKMNCQGVLICYFDVNILLTNLRVPVIGPINYPEEREVLGVN